MLSDDEIQALLRGADSVQKIATQGLHQAPNIAAKIHFIGNLQRGVDQIQFAANAAQAVSNEQPQFACQPGCSHCCEVPVKALVPEIFQIVAALQQLPAEAQQQWRARLQERIHVLQQRQQQEGLPQQNSASSQSWRLPCVFLQDHLCTIYQLRPAVCRKAHSYHVTACADHLPEIPQSLQVLLQAEALIKGTAAAYTAQQLDGSAHELTQAVLAALDDETLLSRWANGEAVFNQIND